MSKFLKKNGFTIVVLLILASGIGLLLFPRASNFIQTINHQRIIRGYREMVENMHPADIAAYIEEAHDFNQNVAPRAILMQLSPEDLDLYFSILNFDGVIGYVSIDKINVM